MSADSSKRELIESLAKLKANRDAMPWTERRSLAASLAPSLTTGAQQESANHLLRFLAVDPKWEVRREVATLLPLLPEDDFAPLTAQLVDDSNGYVRKAAERALSLRQRRSPEPGLKGFDRVVASFDWLEGTPQGKSAGKRVRALAIQLYEISVSSTVHDLKNVLTSASLKVAALQSSLHEDLVDKMVILDRLSKVADRLAYLERYVDSMNLYSQTVPLDRETATLSSILEEAREFVTDSLGPEHLAEITTSITVEEDVSIVIARHELVAAISNVIRNAFDAILFKDDERPGTVVVAAGKSGEGEVRIVVEDNGVGVPAENLKKLREFIPGRTTKKGVGTGFGLPIAQRYISGHGGSISIDSTEDVGTTVTIILPTETE